MAEESNITTTKELTELLGDQASDVLQVLIAFYQWMLIEGLNPDKGEGLSEATADNYIDRLDQLWRIVIERFDPDDPTRITPDQADLIIDWLNDDKIRRQTGEPYAETGKRKLSNALEKYFLWRYENGELTEKWKPKIEFSQSKHDSPDYLTFTELWDLREAAKGFRSLPDFFEVDEDERDRIKGLIAQRLGKPKDEVTKKDWSRADWSTKIGSLVQVSLETGLAPSEIGKAATHWYNRETQMLEIPEEHAIKERDTCELPLTSETAELLEKWLRERRMYEKYDDTNLIWLNQQGNPYDSKNLSDLIDRICDEAGITTTDRQITWYSLRHTLGHTMTETEGLAETNDQLRHDTYETTNDMYGNTAPQSRRNTLKKINKISQLAAENPHFDPYDDDQMSDAIGYGDQTITRLNSRRIHVDETIKRTPSAINDLIQKLLAEQTQE